MEHFCEEVWFSRDKECAKIMLKNKMTKMTKYERSLLNHVVVSDDIVEYEEEPLSFVEMAQLAIDNFFSRFKI
jgi:hypothetical protein